MMKAAIRKELQLLRRDPRVIVRLMVLPVAFIALFGMVFKQAGRADKGHPIAVWADPANPRAKAAIAALDGSQLYHTVPKAAPADVQRAVADASFDVGLVFPAGFDPKGGGAKAQLVIDTSRSLVERGPVQGAVTGIVTRALLGEPVQVVEVVAPPSLGVPAEQPSAFQLTVPGNAVLFGFFIALTCALSFAEERRTGTWRRLLATPIPRWKLLVAKLVPYVALGTLQVGFLFAIGAVVFGMEIAGSIPALAVLTFGVALCATGLGLAIAAVSSTEKQISSLGSVVILIMGLVGGCMLPRALMPHVLQQIGLGVPHGWALDGYYTLLVHNGSGFADVAKPIAAVYGFAALFIGFGVRRFRFDG
ncbi:MAG TPA: ABC transporter permease [Kofleriaceae bacterium]|jgi:ABC-2 type transport system permease protein